MAKILDHIRVLDVGRYVAGPYAATLLGYLGAEVIRIEKPGGGEDRYIAPLFREPSGKPGVGGLFMQTACGKKSVTLNLSTKEGRCILQKLAAEVDVVVANLPVPTLKKFGIDWPSFSSANPKGILVTQTGFGTRGPDSQKGGFDGVAQAMSGAMYLSGTPDTPIKAGAPYVDFSTAVFSAMGTLAALMGREQSGKGQHVQTTLLGTALACLSSHLAEQAVTGLNRIGTNNQVQTSAPSDVFKTRDGHILVHTVGDGLFKRWAQLVGRGELIDNPDFQGDQNRGNNRAELCKIMADWTAKLTTEQALGELQSAGIPSGPILTLQEAVNSQQVQAMEFFQYMDFPGLPRQAPVASLPIEFSTMEHEIPSRPPLLGEHTDQVLKSLGYSDKTMSELREKGVI